MTRAYRPVVSARAQPRIMVVVTAPWHSGKKNREYHERMLAGINAFLGTSFTEQDIETIYTYFGNAIKSRDAEAFIDGGYDMRFFEKYRRAEK